MSKEKNITSAEISKRLCTELTINDGVVKVNKDIVFSTLPDDLSKENFVKSLDFLSAFDSGFKTALATTSLPYFKKNSDSDMVTGVASIGHHKFTAKVSREHTARNPSNNEEYKIKGYVQGGFKLSIPAADRNEMKESISDLYKNL